MAHRDKSCKFIELANNRVNRAIKDLRLISNLANRRNYDFTDEQARKIVKTLQKEVEFVRQSFQSSDDQDSDRFQL